MVSNRFLTVFDILIMRDTLHATQISKNMKKILFCAALALISAPSIAQTWTGTTTTGLVGIGTSSPDASLAISRAYSYVFGAPSPKPAFKIQNTSTSALYISGNIFEVWNSTPTPGNELIMSIANNGMVKMKNGLAIGNTIANGPYANYKLSVDGDIIAKRCVIQVTNWADFVFDNDYTLTPLEDVATFVKTNKHLPGVPSEEEIKKDGIEMGQMNKILMQKVEELTLYIIDLKKEVNELKAKN